MLVAVDVICCALLGSTFVWHAPLAQLGFPDGSSLVALQVARSRLSTECLCLPQPQLFAVCRFTLAFKLVFAGGWTLIILILSLRILAGIFGIVGACRRKVRAVKRTSAEAAAKANPKTDSKSVFTVQESILEFDLFHHFDGSFVILLSASEGHYYFLVVNLLLSLVIARPLWLCDCFCFEPSQDLVMCLGSRTMGV